ncbi:MAG TPA: ribbon-helix-helix protein, CopG family [Methanobacteriaceae archaeon]|nr:ribbon-helix-helix protein, CopG family [Methanobacteriaceae archaeon]HNS25781.1 ribbon-helix-helix protein, CopG family [Methanobacteriaceae archaeon]
MEIMKVKACFDIEEEDLNQIDVIAKKEERSRSFILREAVRKYLEK